MGKRRTRLLQARGEILDEIMQWKRQELPKRQRETPIADLQAMATVTPPPPDFATALRPPDGPRGTRLIAEIKRASPVRGLLCRDFDPEALAETYARNGAVAISCLTDSRFFQGDLSHLVLARERLKAIGRPLPFLRKDFIFDPYQVLEARAAGASAILLIAAVLSDRELRKLIAEARQLHMTPLVEVHDEAEVDRALAAGATVIGINNRDLRTFRVDLETTARLRPRIPQMCIVVAESGIRSADDVRRLRDMGVDAILVGEALVRADPAERVALIRALTTAGMSR
ncbi:MAG: indole-3-glycerol phosphate synthase TrpC [Anaerolineae bacterium]|nr:indole-3-glycerol phosphate synthase TrpC [Anaerolineae bacterium]MDW8100482.1 indole-3-glycerol phosphate synthase TrpC [Anaerolineae bacterium]